MRDSAAIEVLTLTDGGQTAEAIAERLTGFLSQARRSLDIALYDVRLPGAVGDSVAGALKDAAARGIQVRLLYNTDSPHRLPVPPPPSTRPELIEALPFPTRDVPGEPDLMHHKYVVRDEASVWTGSTNWTTDAWQRQENVLLTVDSAGIAAAYKANFEELWERRSVEHSGHRDAEPVTVDDATVRAWFCPGRGRRLAHRIAEAIGRAQKVRIASPVITSAPILATLAQRASDGDADVAGVVDATQVAQVFRQWHDNGNAEWKVPLLARAVGGGRFTGKRSTPYAPGALHDYMHAKVTVADDTVFVGSFNLSRSGEANAENVLEVENAALAARLAAYIDAIRARFPELPSFAGRIAP
ncbi:MAG: hypothetical protein QOE06_2717 [Thermoleophilaceae bacterium]|nr:hypothetical protein [Thermoleophilaceae bacterium]